MTPSDKSVSTRSVSNSTSGCTALISRRAAVASFGLGLGSLVLRPRCLQAAPQKLSALEFIVVSDTHLGYRDAPHAAEQWVKTAAELAQAPGPLVLHLGDVVDGGREAQYPIYLETRKTIGKPVYEIPGNHDPHELFAKHIRKPIDIAVDHQWLRFVLVGNAHTDSHDGFLTIEQLQWIDAQCREAGEQDRYVLLCMHVPAHANLHPDRGWYVKPEHGQTELYKLLERHRERVLCLMHGHFHNGIRGWDDHTPQHEIVFPSALYNNDRHLEEQKAPGYNLPEFRPGYTLVNIQDGAMTLRYRPVGTQETADKKFAFSQLAS